MTDVAWTESIWSVIGGMAMSEQKVYVYLLATLHCSNGD